MVASLYDASSTWIETLCKCIGMVYMPLCDCCLAATLDHCLTALIDTEQARTGVFCSIHTTWDFEKWPWQHVWPTMPCWPVYMQKSRGCGAAKRFQIALTHNNAAKLCFTWAQTYTVVLTQQMQQAGMPSVTRSGALQRFVQVLDETLLLFEIVCWMGNHQKMVVHRVESCFLRIDYGQTY